MECLPKEYNLNTLTSIPKCPTEQICVKSCPKENKFFSSVSAKKSEMYCKYKVNATTSSKSMSELVSDKDCAPYVLASESLLGRCIPTVIGEKLKEFLNNNDFTSCSVAFVPLFVVISLLFKNSFNFSPITVGMHLPSNVLQV
jgi:hypothetical protein